MTAPARFPSFRGAVAPERLSNPTIGVLTSRAPAPSGLASFSAGLVDGLSARGCDVGAVGAADGGESPSISAAVELLNRRHVAIVQHDDDAHGDDVLDAIEGLRVPTILVAHSVLKHPTAQQYSTLVAMASKVDRVVVLSAAAHDRLCLDYGVERRKVTVIQRGATLPTAVPLKRGGRPTLLTWGLMRPGKGVERVIDAMASLKELRGQPCYHVAGATHPAALAADGEAYRDACVERARSVGVAGAVKFDAIYRSTTALSALIQTSAAVVLPYDSTDQVNSGALIDALAAGRPVVATAFPHAIELLGCGAGVIVDHDDPDALTFALRRMLTDPRMTGEMAAEARKLAPTLGWPVTAAAYQALARRVVTERSALV